MLKAAYYFKNQDGLDEQKVKVVIEFTLANLRTFYLFIGNLLLIKALNIMLVEKFNLALTLQKKKNSEKNTKSAVKIPHNLVISKI